MAERFLRLVDERTQLIRRVVMRPQHWMSSRAGTANRDRPGGEWL